MRTKLLCNKKHLMCLFFAVLMTMLIAIPTMAADSTKATANSWKKTAKGYTNGNGTLIPNSITRGVDVSYYDGTINWSKAKGSIDFAIIRVCDGTTRVDSKYKSNLAGANAANIPAGVYIFSRATSVEEAKKEAKFILDKIDGFKISYPICYDMEATAQTKLSKTALSNIAIAFCKEIKKAGYYPMIYTNPNWIYNYLDMSKLSDYDLWVANYTDKAIRPLVPAGTKYSIWQIAGDTRDTGLKSTAGLIPGFSKTVGVDLNIGFVDYTKIITPRTKAIEEKKGWVTEDGKTYYYRDGEKLSGRRKIGSKWYRFATSDGHLFTSTLLYSKTTKQHVYVGEDGAEVYNQWITVNNKTYYMGSADQKGCAVGGEQLIEGKYYLFDEASHVLRKNKLVRTRNIVYFYGADGARVQGKTLRINGNLYRFSSANGRAFIGWHHLGSKKYYFYNTNDERCGRRVENATIKISGVTYTFDENGNFTQVD